MTTFVRKLLTLVWAVGRLLGLQRASRSRQKPGSAALHDSCAQCEKKLDEVISRLNAILDATKIAIIVTDTQGIIRIFNRGAEEMLQYRASEVAGAYTPYFFFQNPGHEAGLTRMFLLPSDQPDEVCRKLAVCSYVRKDGATIDVNSVAAPIRSGEGAVIGFLIAASDITAQKALERELRSNNEQLLAAMHRAEKASRAKSQFLATMSHEIRTPMNGVFGVADILLATALTREQRRLVGILKDSGEVLLGLLNDILDFSKIEAGKLELERASFDLHSATQSSIEMLSSKARAKGLKIDLDFPSDVPRKVNGDPTRYQQILLNLLSNAIKFSERGDVRIALRQLSAQGSAGMFEISVKDNGIGIPLEIQSEIFDSFVQADASTTRKYGGTGLGLAIVKRLVNLMNGEISLESAPGKGCLFRFSIRLGIEESLASDDAPRNVIAEEIDRASIERYRILLAEDNPTNRLIARTILSKAGFDVDVAEDGEQAVEAITQRAYSLVLMDCQMPKLDGVQATKKIRQMPGKIGKIPIIALTANAFNEDKRICEEAGMDDFLTKPFKSEKLIQTCLSWARRGKLSLLPAENSDVEVYSAEGTPDCALRQ